MTPQEALSYLPTFLNEHPEFLVEPAASVLENAARTTFGINPFDYAIALADYKRKLNNRSTTMNLDQIAKTAYDAQCSEARAYLPHDAEKPAMWGTPGLALIEPRARALSILKSDVTHEQLAAWAATKHDSTGYNQGDFPCGATAFQSVCIDLREFWDGVVPRD